MQHTSLVLFMSVRFVDIEFEFELLEYLDVTLVFLEELDYFVVVVEDALFDPDALVRVDDDAFDVDLFAFGLG